MRHLVLTLALLGACADAPSDALNAPSVDVSLSQKSMQARLDDLERLAKQQAKQLAAAETTIKTLETRLNGHDSQLTALGGNMHVLDDAVLTFRSQLNVQGGTLAVHDQALMGLDSTITVQGGNLRTLGASVATLTAGQAQTDQLLEQIFGGPGRQGGHLTVLEDYALALSGYGVDAGPSGTTDEYLQRALFDTDPVTGASVPRVDGLGAELGARLRKRPELLTAEWDAAIDSSITTLSTDPSTVIGALQAHKGLVGSWLFDDVHPQDSSSLRSVLDSIAATNAAVADLGRTIYTDPDPGDAIDETTVGALQRRLGTLETSTATFVDDFQGEVEYLKINDHYVWTESHDQRARLDNLDLEVSDLRATGDFVYGQVSYLDTRLASAEGTLALTVKDVKELADILKSDYGLWKPQVDADLKSLSSKLTELQKAMQSGDAAVAAAASKEVKDLADILKSEYGIPLAAAQSGITKLDGRLTDLDLRVSGQGQRVVALDGAYTFLKDSLTTTRGDVDALWIEVALADDDLQKQLDALSGEVCAIGDMADALLVGDDAAARAAYERRGGVCMLSGIVRN